ncbi:MAG: FMN-binding glutamate synthase family protein [Maricaulaceae bacterium]|jgi:glutamate synthase domain-containing protein 2
MRYLPFAIIVVLTIVLCILASLDARWLWLALPGSVLTGFGVIDVVQREHTLWRNYPVAGRVRWLAEALRPFVQQYFIESVTDGRPFNREDRSLVYRRAKDVSSVEPFGSHIDVDGERHEWIAQSIAAKPPAEPPLRIEVGAGRCAKPYAASVFNISAMSFGSLGGRAIEALNRGAAAGGFYHDTGEGAVSPYHRAGGGDLVWELGSGYFGARAADGRFDSERFKDLAAIEQIKMIEVKLSQGAKPGHGGILPASKITPEIAATRGIAIGADCVSPPAHTAFSTPIELVAFVEQLRELSGGKPVGIKLCIGHAWELLAIVKAMLATGGRIDYVVVDGAEGGTGAAPVEFQDHVGAPLREGLLLTRNALVGAGLADEVRLAASGKIISGFQLAAAMALGADWCNAARGFMFALGCVQSLQCHTNKCPTGVATQDLSRQRGLDVADKAARVASFHRNTVHALAEVVGAAGLAHPSELTPDHLLKQISSAEARPASEVYDLLAPGALIEDPVATPLAADWARAQAESFAAAQ